MLVDTHAAERDALRTKAESAVGKEEWNDCHALYMQMDDLGRAVNDASAPMTPSRQTCEEGYFRSLDSKTRPPKKR